MYAKNLDEMHRLISERLGRIQGVQRSESFIEMKRTTKPMPYKPAK
jgi:Lrp/AsnC family transcriptional regulator, regulator for asnA, asnC and gidA